MFTKISHLLTKTKSYGIMAASRHYTCAEPLAPEGSQNTAAASAPPSERYISGGYGIIARKAHAMLA